MDKDEKLKVIDDWRKVGSGETYEAKIENRDRASILEDLSTAYFRCNMQTENGVALQRERLVSKMKQRPRPAHFGKDSAEELLLCLALFLEERDGWEVFTDPRPH